MKGYHSLFSATEAMSKFNIEKVLISRNLAERNTDQERILPCTSRKRHVLRLPSKMSTGADKQQFDSRKGATWHCIVGRNFGSFVTHGILPNVKLADQVKVLTSIAETKHFIYFYLGHVAILLFKTQ